MAFPPGFLDEIRDRVSIASVIGRKLSWDQRKSNPAKGDYWACCPFHQEKTSSFHVEDRKGFYYCFGCQAKGDAITFMKEAENLSFLEAVEALAGEAGLTMPDRDPRADAREARRKSLVDVMEQAAQFFRLQLRAAKGAEARGYLDKRGLKAETIERFEIGYAPDTRSALREHLTGKGVEIKQLDEAGLVIVPDDGGQPFDRFRGRIMFPIRDARGRCIAFGGRAMNPDARAKYLNSPETALFDKGRSLYNHGPAREAAGKTGALIVAEGYMDVIALAQAGFNHAVAPLGTAVTEDQLSLLWRIADEPVIALDGDKAGVRAAMKVMDLALPRLTPGQSLRFAIMPEGRDPDDLIKAEGPKAMQAALDAALPMVELLWRRETEGQVFDSPERRSALDARLRKALGRIEDQNLRAHYGQAIKERRAKLFAPAQISRPARGDFRGRKPWGAPEGASAMVKASPLARGGDARGEARGREAAMLLALLTHPRVAEAKLAILEDLEFLAQDLDDLRQALISAVIRLDGTAPTSSDLIDAIACETGENPIGRLQASPQARAASFARLTVADDIAEHGFEETLARHRALLALDREVAEAEAEMSADPGDDVASRLTEAALRKFRDGAPPLPEGEDDESHLSARLRAVLEGIPDKKARKRS